MRPWGIVAFDIDGTITKVISSWQFAHERLGTWEKAREYQDLYNRGLATFSEWAELDVSIWKGLPISIFNKLAYEIPIYNDAKTIVNGLKDEGFITGTISSCIPLVSDRLKQELGMNFAISHSFQDRNGFLEGIKTVVTPMNKHIHLSDLAKSYSISLERTVAVGDNWVDAKMLEIAGLGIAFNPNDETVRAAARITIKGDRLQKILDEVLKWKLGYELL